VTTDVVVVGAGPAGVSAALWARSLDLVPVVIEAGAEPGGQLHLIHFHPLDLAGVASGAGPEIASVLAAQLRDAGVEVRCAQPAVSLEGGTDAEPPRVVTADGGSHPAPAALVATGVRRRRLDVPGDRELEGRGVSYSATRDRALLAGRPVAVVGGGDAAFENALLLAASGSRVTLIVRGEPRARREFRERVAADRRIEVLHGARVAAILGQDVVSGVRIESDGGAFERAVEGVVVKIGVIPNTGWCAAALALDPEGFVVVDEALRTSRPRVWAAGDVTRPAPPGVAPAFGHGARAIGAIRAFLRPA